MPIVNSIELEESWRAADFLKKVVAAVGRIGIHPEDSAEIRLQKAILCNVLVFGGIPTQVCLVIVAAVFGEPAMFIAVSASVVISIGGLVLLGYTRRFFSFFKFVQLALPLLVPFVCLILTGGLVNIAFSMIWSILPPLLALVLYPPRQAVYWLLAFLSLVVIGFAAQPYLRPLTGFPTEAIWMIGYGNLFAFSIMIFAALAILIHQRNVAYRLLHAEQERALGLLHNILPSEIATILQEREGVIADHFASASVLFADVVNFTPMSAAMAPTELVNLLNEVFSYMDALTEKYCLEKIKTIGDCYMVAAGVPTPRTDHAQALCSMALEFRNYVKANQFQGRSLEFRIGIHSGPLVAGVIGRRKFIYDLWGDTVNTASRMESHGCSNIIQISRQTYDLVQREFVCESQGMMHIKGKGDMEVWSLIAAGNSSPTVVRETEAFR